MKYRSHLIITALLLINASLVIAQAPPRISIQGQLKEATGALTPDGTYTAIFNLYDNLAGGTANWSETATIECIGGIYSHELGSVNPLVATVFGQTQYLGVRIGATEANPRTELTYAPYTFASNTALIADEVICSGAVGDVKYSIYNPTKFAEVNGSCWVPMDGRNITGKKLATLLGASTIPDASGLFIRSHPYSNGQDPDRTTQTQVAEFQEDAVQGHTHTGETLWEPDHEHSVTGVWVQASGNTTTDGVGSNGGWYQHGGQSGTLSPVIDHEHSLNIDFTGAVETRPINMNFYIYIRVD